MNELLPCPFCGGEAYTRRTIVNDDAMYVAFCMDCGASSAYYDENERAVASWNRRVEPDDSGWDKVTDIVDPVHVVTDIDDCPAQRQCPSCHKADGICAVDFRGEYLVYCPKCNLRTISCASLADAIAVWDKVNKDES